MTDFGIPSKYLNLLKDKIQEVFGANSDVKVYLFGSRATGKQRKYSDVDLAFSSKDQNLNKKISLLKNKLEDSSFPYKVDLVNWAEIIDEFLPSVKKEKKVFWTKKEAIVRSPWRICPVGYHWVKEHTKSGNSDATNGHCRKNPSRKDIINTEELKKISELDIFQNPPLQASSNDMGFRGKEKKYDRYINGWSSFWNDILNPELRIDPNIVKALIATESSFEENPPRSASHTAIGITQLMPKTLKLLSSRSNELKNNYLEISKEEAFDPNVNIAASIRWLFRKYEIVRSKKKNVTWFDVIEEYKGIRNQKGPKSDEIRQRFNKEYKKLTDNINTRK